MSQSDSVGIEVSGERDVIEALDSKRLFAAYVDGFMDLVWAERERRLQVWAADDWTQAEIAVEVGRSQQAVSLWLARFEIETSSPRGRPRELQTPGNSKRRKRKPAPQLVDWLPDMLPGATPEGAFRQEVLAWCSQGETIDAAGDGARVELAPKSEQDREALLWALKQVHKTAAKLERQLGK